MASLDVRRPAAMEQLAVLGQQIGVETLPIVAGQQPAQIASRAHPGRAARRLRRGAARHRRPHHARRRDDGGGGRGQARRQSARSAAGRRQPHRPGRRQSRALVRRARRPDRHRADPRRRRRPRRRGAVDARGHRQADQADRHRRDAWMRWRTSTPRASPAASSAWATSSRWSKRPPRPSTREQAMRAAERMRKGQFDLNDLREQLSQMQQMGGMSGLMGMLPGVAKMKNQLAERQSRRQRAQAPDGDHRLDDAEGAQAIPTSSRPAARSASPPAPAPRSRTINSCSRCTGPWPT